MVCSIWLNHAPFHGKVPLIPEACQLWKNEVFHVGKLLNLDGCIFVTRTSACNASFSIVMSADVSTLAPISCVLRLFFKKILWNKVKIVHCVVKSCINSSDKCLPDKQASFYWFPEKILRVVSLIQYY